MSNKPELITSIRGDKTWFLNGKFHREDGPAIIYPNGDKEWYINGVLHRDDGPAIETAFGKIKEWYVNGLLHRVDGPAIEYSNEIKHWCLNGKEYSQEEWFNKLTSEQQDNYLWNLDVK
jgi:hypothetical protein